MFQGRLSIILGIQIASLALTGCSVDMFSSQPKDPAITGQKNYREIKPGCSSFSIPESGLDPQSFRALVECFNRNGSIPEMEALTRKANDRTLSALTHILNEAFFRNESQIAETYIFFRHLDSRDRLEDSVKNITGIFKDADSISALFNFLDEARTTSLGPNIRESKKISKWIDSLSAESFELYLGVFEKVLRSQAWEGVSEAFRKQPLSSSEKKVIRDSIRDWISGPGSKSSTSLDLFTSIARGSARDIFQVLLENTNASAQCIDQVFLQGGERPLIDSFEGLRRGLSTPLTCMGGSLKFKDPWSQLLSELKQNRGELFYDFSLRRGSVQTLILKECCTIPTQVLNSYERILRAFGGRDGVLLSRVLESGVQNGLGDVFGRWMDRDSRALSPLVQIFLKRGVSRSALELLSEVSDLEWEKIGRSIESFSKSGYFTELKLWFSRLQESDYDRIGGLIRSLPGLEEKSEKSLVVSAIREMRNLLRASDRHSWWVGIQTILKDAFEGKNDFATLSELSRLPEFSPAVRMIHEMGVDGRLAPMLYDLVRLYASTVKTFPSEALVPESWSDESRKKFVRRSTQSYVKPSYAKACSSLKLESTIESQKSNFYGCIGTKSGAKELEAWVNKLDARQSSQGSKLSQALFGSVIELLKTDFKTDSKARWLGNLVRTHSLSEFAESVHGVYSYSKGEFAKLSRRLLSQLLERPHDLERFFVRLFEYSKTKSFLIVNRWVDSSRNSTHAIPPTRFRGIFDRTETFSVLKQKECVVQDQELERRLSELKSDITSGIVGWESVGGRSRMKWTENDLLTRLSALQPYLKDPYVANGIRKLFIELRSRHGSLAILDWFESRSLDVKPVMYIFPGEREARVRWMSTLDRLEVLLTAADFKFASWFFEDNFALKFISQIGESWGDEPRESWPLEIQKKYSGRQTPPTLSDTYEDIQSFLNKFSNLGGLPKVGKCSTAREDDPLITAPEALVPFWVKANLYNLKQVLSVYEENLPSAQGGMRNGMRFLRDLFYFVDSSGRVKDRDPSRPEAHPLSIIRALGRLGFLRTSSLYFSHRDLSYRARDAASLELLMKLAHEPRFGELFTKLFTSPSGDDWSQSPLSILSREFFKVSQTDPEALSRFTVEVLPYASLLGEFVQKQDHVSKIVSSILDSQILTNPRSVVGAFRFVNEIETSRLGWKLWKTRASVSGEARTHLMDLFWSDAELIKSVLSQLSHIAQNDESRRLIVDAMRSSEFRRLSQSLQEIFPRQVWLGGDNASSEELGLALRLWIFNSLRVLGPDLMRFEVEDSKNFNEFLIALARFSKSQSFEEWEELYSRHLPR